MLLSMVLTVLPFLSKLAPTHFSSVGGRVVCRLCQRLMRCVVVVPCHVAQCAKFSLRRLCLFVRPAWRASSWAEPTRSSTNQVINSHAARQKSRSTLSHSTYLSSWILSDSWLWSLLFFTPCSSATLLNSSFYSDATASKSCPTHLHSNQGYNWFPCNKDHRYR